MPGRKRKPVNLKVLQGTYRPDRDAGRAILTGELKELPEAPAYITGRGLLYYKIQGQTLLNQKRLTEYDLPLFTDICFLISEVDYYADRINKTRTIQDRRVLKMCHNESHKLMKYALAEFGLTAASVSRVTIPPEKETENPFERFLRTTS